MIKSKIWGSTIEIWSEPRINKKGLHAIVNEMDENIEIVQIEHAYDNMFMVEVVRKKDGVTTDDVIIRDSGYMENMNILLCKESNENKKNM